MSNSLSKDLGLIDGQTYIISRKSDAYVEGCIYINSPSVSKPHLKMRIKNGRIYLRDLNSANGTYLIENHSLEVDPNFRTTRLGVIFHDIRQPQLA